ncbi:hypothetical protein M413DRAFT_446644 [Hebeloma cylindrosporum]|uniref:Calpain catalytic domain-containing protein n=1 Tax=Hebeloma cylindrosporum TaxID=76867 RepID=A0A0C3C834_HEBCY|nr:hypothetical protein M413DRAFT_446644 [Hebeloma cylindrosporum h7]
MQRNTNASPSVRDAEMAYSKASKAEFSRDYDQAFRLYLQAADYFLHLVRSSATSEKSKQEWKGTAAKALERAEKIKRFVDVSRSNIQARSVSASPGQPPAAVPLTPVGIDYFSPQEQFYVLKKGGSVNNLFFPMWDDPLPSKAASEVYLDPDGQPNFSPEQAKVSPVWRRPSSKMAVGLTAGRSRRRIFPQEILQHIVTDCSVCASISVCLEHGLRFGSALESSLHDCSERSNGAGKISTAENGRYDARFLFNGSWRRVPIDDRLPFHPTQGTLMCMSILPSTQDSQRSAEAEDILWPSLLEKAYMKLMGGYDFPGSNSSIDLHTLAGWIPEHIEIKSSTFEREKTWERIEKGFSAGHCVVTLGTGAAPHVRWRDTPLLPSHSYAVIDAYETDIGRLLTVLDSWVRSDEDQGEPSRVLQIPWSEVLNTFDGIYLSWDPNMWERRLTFHGQLQVEFSCDSTLDEEIWLLLTRHVVDTHRTSDFTALRVEVEDDVAPRENAVENQHILSSKGTYTNSTHILVRTRVPLSQRSGVLSVSASYDGDAREVGFTLTAYAKQNTKISWIKDRMTPPYTSKVQGLLTSKNAGGNCTYPTFMVNPQYQLILHPLPSRPGFQANGGSSKAKLTLTLQTNKDIPVNVAVVWSQGKRVSELSAKEMVATSGAYSYGSARASKNILVGEYTVIASAFEPHHIGPFSLTVDSSVPFDLKPIAQEGAGMYTKLLRGSWDGETAAGGPSSNHYSKNPVFELQVPATTQLKYVQPQFNMPQLDLSAQQNPPSTSSTVNLYCTECYCLSGFSK